MVRATIRPDMKAILLEQAELTSIAARVDRSIRFSVVTGELTDDHRAAFFPLQGTNVKILIQPADCEQEPAMVVPKGDTESKSPSQRLRSVLFVYYKQLNAKESFEDFYARQIELVIEKVKTKLDD